MESLVRTCPKLELLELNYGRFSDKGLSAIQKLNSLESLILGPPFSDDALQIVAGQESVTSLWIDGPGFSDKAIPHLKKMTWLEDLTIGELTRFSDKGIKQLEQALPEGIVSDDRFRDEELADYDYEKGNESLDKGDFVEAAEFYTDSFGHEPNLGAWINRASALDYAGQFEKAVIDYTLVMRIAGDPDDKRLAEVYYNRGYAHERHGALSKAMADYEQTIKLDARVRDVHNNLAWILATAPDAKMRDGKRAVELAKKGWEETQWKKPSCLDTLAAAHAEAGDFDEAVKWIKKAIELEDDEPTKNEFNSRLKRFTSGKPYHQTKESR